MPPQYVARINSTIRGNCKVTKDVIGRHVNAPIGISITKLLCPKTRNNVAPKAMIIAVVERNNMVRPIISFFGNLKRKSCSAKRAVRIDKNINNDVTAVNNDIAIEIENTENAMLLVKIGIPDS